MVLSAHAQLPWDTLALSFEDSTALLNIDSIYPPGCWQIGAPSKPVFTSAFTEPNALVTDTLLPHADSTTCYAEMSTVVEDDGYYGKWLSFRHRMDMDSLLSFGWVEIQAPFDTTWYRIGDPYNWFLYMTELSGDGTNTDSGLVFTGSNVDWTEVSVSLDCLTLLFQGDADRGGGSQAPRFRFVFRSAAQPALRDGWMIDDIRLTSRICLGAVPQRTDVGLTISPVPALDHIILTWGSLPKGRGVYEIVDGRGAIVQRTTVPSAMCQELDVHDLPTGAYTVRALIEGGCATARFCVQR